LVRLKPRAQLDVDNDAGRSQLPGGLLGEDYASQ
jgi:hypothetical protein